MTHLPLFDINYISNTLKGLHLHYGTVNPSLPFVKERIKNVLRATDNTANPLTLLNKIGNDFFNDNIFPEEIFNSEITTMQQLRETINVEEMASMFSRFNIALAEIAPYNMELYMKASEQWGKFGYNIFSLTESSFPTEMLPQIAESSIIGVNIANEFNNYGNYAATETTAELSENGFILNTPNALSFKENIISAGEATYAIIHAKTIVRGADFGVFPYLIQLKNSKGQTVKGVHLTEHSEIFPTLKTGRMFLHDLKTPTTSLLSRFGAVRPSPNGFSVEDYFKNEQLKQFIFDYSQNFNHIHLTTAINNIGFANLTTTLGWTLTYGKTVTKNEQPHFTPLINMLDIRETITANYVNLYNQQNYNNYILTEYAKSFAEFTKWGPTNNVKNNRKMVNKLNMEFINLISKTLTLLSYSTVTKNTTDNNRIMNIQSLTSNSPNSKTVENINKMFHHNINIVEETQQILPRIASLYASHHKEANPEPTIKTQPLQTLFPTIKNVKNPHLDSIMFPQNSNINASNFMTKHYETDTIIDMEELIKISHHNNATISHLLHKTLTKTFKKYNKQNKENHISGLEHTPHNIFGVNTETIIHLWAEYLTYNHNLSNTLNVLKHKLTPQGYAYALMLNEKYGTEILKQHNILTQHKLFTNFNNSLTKRSNQLTGLLSPNLWFILKDYGYDEDFLKNQEFVTILKHMTDNAG